VALFLACTPGLFQGGSAQAQRNLTAQRNPTGAKELPVEIRSTGGTVTLEKATIMLDEEFRVLKLFMSNKSSQPVNRLQYSYTIYEPDGKVRGGGNSIQKVELPANSPIEQWTLLHNEVGQNDRVVLVFEGSSNK
jgi:hypothetical protein